MGREDDWEMGQVVWVIGLDFSIQLFDDLPATECFDVTACTGDGCFCEEVSFFGHLWCGRGTSYLTHEREEGVEAG